jgi:hypothetical protein
MGYYSNFTLTVDGKESLVHEEAVSEETGCIDCWNDEIKWYDMEDDMKSYSERYPNNVFQVIQNGEDGEIVAYFFVGGKSYSEDVEIPKIVYPTFDQTKLK